MGKLPIKRCMYTFVFFITFALFILELVDKVHYCSDLPTHTVYAYKFLQGDMIIPHPGFHILVIILSFIFKPFIGLLNIKHVYAQYIPYGIASAVILSSFIAITLFIIDKLLNKKLDKVFSNNFLFFVAVSLIFCSAIYIPFFNSHIYLGQGSPNVWHNPTFITVRAFALISFILFTSIFNNNINAKTKDVELLSLLMFITTLFKPNFLIIFFPASVIYSILILKLSYKELFKLLISFLPAIFLLFIQYLILYYQGSQTEVKDHIVIDFLGVWSKHSPNPFISMILLLAFPLSVLICRFKSIINNNSLILVWIAVFISLIQAMFFAEQGRYSAGNFFWGYLLFAHILFIYSMIEFLPFLKSYFNVKLQEKAQIIFITVVYNIHFITGIYYFSELLLGYNYY